ncbi:glycosyltransferase family protein [Abyssibacter profundi]|uniref:Teichoic acid biosynthesis protein n=1 Tax=Abyssibacter profundi TaxID=2182787 RepID=A0A363UL10_9GAMM|nr:glycosyltransferase family protein [Abyssibacter profundi]PWN56087.1 hypothetical protein DEH80_09770 [Abyssibacter profundi]
MRIAYGVMGYGRGHAMRTGTVLPHLMKHHDVRVFAAADAYKVLAPRFPTTEIPLFRYHYGRDGRYSLRRTVGRNIKPIADLLFQLDGMQSLMNEFAHFRPDVVISDSEAWTLRAAEAMGIPRLSFDHVGIIAHCEPHFPWELRLAGARDAMGYRYLMGEPERILISSFYPATPKDARTRVIGPLMRDEVLGVTPTQGEHLLAYFNKGEHLFRPQVEEALRKSDRPVIVYGTERRGQDDNLLFKAPANAAFVRDLANAKAVIGTSGNQLAGEAIHFGKPILALPEDAFEQRLNAYMIERMGVGMRRSLSSLHVRDIEDFLAMSPFMRNNMDEHRRDGRAEAQQWLDTYIDELAGDRTRRSVGPAVNGWMAQTA